MEKETKWDRKLNDVLETCDNCGYHNGIENLTETCDNCSEKLTNEKEIFCAKCGREAMENEGFALFTNNTTNIYLCTDCLMETQN